MTSYTDSAQHIIGDNSGAPRGAADAAVFAAQYGAAKHARFGRKSSDISKEKVFLRRPEPQKEFFESQRLMHMLGRAGPARGWRAG